VKLPGRPGPIGIAAIFAALVWTSVAGFAPILRRPLADPDAIVSLASHEWERLPVAAALGVRYPHALVVLTLPTVVSLHNCHDCFHRVDRLVALGIARDRVRILQLSIEGTRGEAEACRRFAMQTPVRRLLIVTSVYHTRRALSTFAAIFAGSGIELGIEPAWYDPPARPGTWWLNPYDRWYVTYEWAGAFYYLIRYGIRPVLS